MRGVRSVSGVCFTTDTMALPLTTLIIMNQFTMITPAWAELVTEAERNQINRDDKRNNKNVDQQKYK